MPEMNPLTIATKQIHLEIAAGRDTPELLKATPKTPIY